MIGFGCSRRERERDIERSRERERVIFTRHDEVKEMVRSISKGRLRAPI